MDMASLLTLLLFTSLSFAQNASQLDAALKKNPDDMKTRERLAAVYAGENKADQAIELLNPYTDQLSESGFLLLANSYSKQKDYANEVRTLNFLIVKDEENFKWHMLVAQAYLKQASETKDEERNKVLLTSAIQRMRRVLQINPKYKPAFDQLLSTFLQQQANNEARELLMEGVNRFGKRPELFRELCRLDSQDGFLVQAVGNCSESINLTPEYTDHYVYMVQALHDQKEDLRAENLIVKAAKKFPQSEFVQWAAGELFLRKKNYPVAARYFQVAVKAKPTSGRAQFGLAKSLFENNQDEAALEPFIQACKLEPNALEVFMGATGRMKQKGNGELTQKYIRAANTCR